MPPHPGARDLPAQGGEPPQVVVHIPLHTLIDGLGPAAYQDGVRISPGLARKHACCAKLIPAVLGSESAVLDLGRAQRLFTGARRRAVTLRDKGCAFPGCDRPPASCDIHHILA
ncbi:MAG: HNH endonuclease [Geodermatophilaceae bacterium]|nr:HNH endonuclease [Geodermatophilaceae bacterium]